MFDDDPPLRTPCDVWGWAMAALEAGFEPLIIRSYPSPSYHSSQFTGASRRINMSESNASDKGLNILCIDGGGVRGLSSLLLLEELMKRIQHLEKLDSPPSPHQYFDIIAGTGTGAIQACMLGRLQMSVHSAIESYADLAIEAFSERKWMGSATFKTSKLKDSLVKIIRNATGDPDEPMMDDDSTLTKSKTLVFAMSRHNMRAAIPTAFRSYAVSANEGPRCTIWQTLCATMAHPDLFKSFEIGGPSLKQAFVDAGLGCNNPLAHVLIEAKRLYPGRHVSSIMSIGTGHTRTIEIPDRPFLSQLMPTAAIEAMKGIAEDAEKVAEDMARRFNSTDGVYFRLNVDQGIQTVEVDKWDHLNEVAEHTRAYMKILEVIQLIDKAAETITLRNPTLPMIQIDGEIQVPIPHTSSPDAVSVIRHCPAPTPMYTGCELELSRTESCIIGSDKERKVCVVYGIGGAGKTQMVLKVIERTRGKWGEVIYIDASTQESIENALKDVAIVKKVGNTYQSALQWLESYHNPWLLVLDNADDSSLSIRDYIPRGNHGSVIITTRLSGTVSLARGPHSSCNISSMGPDDALTLLLKCARLHDQELSPEELENAKGLLEELNYFALAIVHAGSYIGHSPHMTVTEYRSLFRHEQRRALEAYSKLATAVKVDDYGHTVYTAWIMCYDALSSRARELLWLIAFLHHTGITIDIFRRAAATIASYKPRLPTTHLAQQKLQTLLSTFLNPDQGWDGILFTEVVNEVLSRSLLEYDRMNQAYRIHALVQSWVRTAIPYDGDLAVECARILLCASAASCVDESLESILFLLSIGLHVDSVLPEPTEKIEVNHALQFSRVYTKRGQWEKAEQLKIYIEKTHKKVLGDEHPDTLTSMNNLANTYSDLGRFEDARALHTQVLDTRKRVLGSDHPDTLTSMNNLANTYYFLGRFEDARALHTQVLDTRKRVLGSDHPDTLTSMNNLANTYYFLGRFEDARALHTQVLDTRKRVLGSDHPDTLTSMNNLANTYYFLGRFEDARALHTQVLDTRKRVLGSDHPDTLTSMNNLANTYYFLGRFEDARALHTQVLDTRKRVLGSDHPNTLSSMNNLASTYSPLGRFDDARALYAQVLDTRKRVLGSDHPDTLTSMHNLADNYLKLGLIQEAEDLSINVDDFVRAFGENDPKTSAARNLARRIQNHRKKRAGGLFGRLKSYLGGSD
ncbi:unnamed protein product [Rhizoctonia solani]|uniref:PNPLA domain-containing protein n=1 Tax=Rhizoctonia solani TaxID=456999 RepID=A0A8H2WAZ8_9AGAM|nr:unnamed protein product [Rhizoctonia solani]